MSHNLIRRTSATAALLLAAAAYAQPAVNEDFGSLTNPSAINRAITISPSTVLWYKLTLPAGVNSGTGTDYLDIRTHNGAGTVIDTEIALYDSTGNFASGNSATSFDDDDGPGLASALSYGSNCTTRPDDPAGAIFDGRDGPLPAGSYYLAVVRYDGTIGPNNFTTPWAVTAGTGAGGAMQLDVNYGTSGPQPAPNYTAATSNPALTTAGSAVLLTATVDLCGATGLQTSINLSSIGGPSNQPMFDDGTNGDTVAGNNVWSVAYTIPGAVAPGTYTLPVTGMNSSSLTGTRNITLTVQGPPAVLTPSAGVYTEVEDNDTKPRANIIQAMTAGQSITGTTTGTSTTVAGNGSADNFRIKTVTAPLGIYRHRLSLNSSTNSHTGTIRGLTQTNRIPNPGTDAALQTSSTTTTNPTPARTNQWYGFGKQEEIYYRVTGTTSTTAAYTATYTVDPVTAVDAGQVFEGNITIDRAAGNTGDVDFYVYDSNFNPVPGYSNDTPNLLTRNFTAGTYYVAWSNFNTANDQPTPADDTFTTGNVMDFPNVVANSSTTTSTAFGIRFTDVTNNPLSVALTKPGFFDVVWVRFQVVPLTTPTNPTGTGTANPASAQITTSTLLSVQVTGGLNPNSTGLAVTGNLSSINGSASQQFYDDGSHGDASAGDNIFSFQANLPEPLNAGTATIPFTVTDAQSRTGSGNITFTLTAPPTGGCCVTGECSVQSAYNCAQSGGTYRGNGTDCGTVSYNMGPSSATFSSIAGTGTMLATVSNCDDCTQVISLPFSFNFFGSDFTSVGVSSNGNLQFVAAPSTAYQNVAIPAAGVPNNAIYPLWDDYNTSDAVDVGQGAIYTQEFGSAPNRTFVVEWADVTQYRLAAPATYPATHENFQVILHEGSNNIEFVYGTCSPVNTSGVNQGSNVDGSGGDCTIGIENATGTAAFSIPSAGFDFASRQFTWTSDPVCAPPCPGNECGPQDYNGDGDSGTDQDIEAFFACLGGNCCATCFCQASDFNGDGDFGTDQDIEAFFRVLGGAGC